MVIAYPETITFPAGFGTMPKLAALIDETIKHFNEESQFLQRPAALRFPSELETIFERETRQKRVRELRFTLSAAAGFLCLSTLTDWAFVPDIGVTGWHLRLLASVVLLCVVVSTPRMSAVARELSTTASTYAAIVVLASLPLLSHADTAAFEYLASTLAMIYALTTVPLRFCYAWGFAAASIAMTAGMLFYGSELPAHLAYAILLLAIIGASFSLIANYRMERSARLGYLLASKEALRLFALSTEREELAVRSSTDPLTGIGNRGHFDRRIARLFSDSANHGTAVHLILIDVDFFKRYNDHYGHPEGDTCLRTVAAVIQQAVRGSRGFAFRYGGEELVCC